MKVDTASCHRCEASCAEDLCSEEADRSEVYALGVDSGSLTAKAVIMDGNKNIIAHSVPSEPQIVGAIGAAIFAVDYALAARKISTQ